MNEREIAAKDLRRGDVLTIDGDDHTVVSARFVGGWIEVEFADRTPALVYGLDELVVAWIPPPSVGYRHGG